MMKRQLQRRQFGRWLTQIRLISWPWRITLGYLGVMLLLPVTAMLMKASTTQPAEFWRIATSPVALKTYDVTFTTALIAAVIDGLFGTLIAWVCRCVSGFTVCLANGGRRLNPGIGIQ
jgi:ABC-type sulfate transport system permease component